MSALRTLRSLRARRISLQGAPRWCDQVIFQTVHDEGARAYTRPLLRQSPCESRDLPMRLLETDAGSQAAKRGQGVVFFVVVPRQIMRARALRPSSWNRFI